VASVLSGQTFVPINSHSLFHHEWEKPDTFSTGSIQAYMMCPPYQTIQAGYLSSSFCVFFSITSFFTT
jgi:hypothetical protein